jgi:hypothetical protein
MRSTQPAARRIERRVAGLASGAAKSACSVSPPAGNPSFALGIYLVTRTGRPRRERDGAGFAARAGHRQEDVMRLSKASQSRLNTIDANQPVAIAIIAVARP